MLNWLKKPFVKMYIARQLKKLGVHQQHHKVIVNAGADIYVIYMLARKLVEDHKEPLTKLFNDTTEQVDIVKILENIQNRWANDISNNIQ